MKTVINDIFLKIQIKLMVLKKKNIFFYPKMESPSTFLNELHAIKIYPSNVLGKSFLFFFCIR